MHFGLIISSAVYAQATVTITGVADGQVCPGYRQGYNFSVPKNACWSYTWTSSGGATIASGHGTHQVNVYFESSINNPTIQVAVSSDGTSTCPFIYGIGSRTFTSKFRTANTSISGPNVVTCTTPVVFTTQQNANAIYQWTLPAGWSGSSTTNTIMVTPNRINGGAITVKEKFRYDLCVRDFSWPAISKSVNVGACTPAITNNNVCCDRTICYNTNSGTLEQSSGSALGGGNGTFTYQWVASTNGVNFINASGASTSSNYSPGLLTQTTWFKRIVSSGTASSTSSPVVITVIPNTLTAIATNYTQSSVKRATTILTIQGNQSSSSSIRVDFISGSEVRVLPSTVLTPNITLKTESCPTFNSGLRIGEEEFRVEGIRDVSMLSAYPNPSNGAITIKYSVNIKGRVVVGITGEKGKEIENKQEVDPGEYEVLYNTTKLKSGIYLYSLETNTTKEAKRLIIQH